MKYSFALGVLLFGCGTGAGPGKPTGGGGGAPEDTGGSGDTDTGVPPEPFVVRVCSDAALRSVQEGLDAAPDGAVVELCGERFVEEVTVVGRRLTLRGEPGAVLDGGGEVRPLTVTGSPTAPAELTVSELTVTGGWSDLGGGVRCDGATLVLEGVTVTGNGAERGGGVAATNCDVRFRRVELSANEAWGEGGGGHVEGGSLDVERSVVAANIGANGGGLLVRGASGEVRDSELVDNQGHVGGGIWFDGDFALTHNRIRGNVARYTGGGFAAVEASGPITRNVVHENQCGTDGAGGFTQAHTGVVSDNHFYDNVAIDDAGGLRMLYGAALVEGNTFATNTASGGSGGAMKVSHDGCEVRGNTFTDNFAADDGGAIEVDDDVSYLVDNTFVGNQAAGRGGAVHFNEPFWDMEMGANVMERNAAGACGGALAIDDDGLPESPEDRYTVAISQVTASENDAPYGSVACLFVGGFAIENALFARNTGSGAAFWLAGATLSLTNVTLASNTGGPAIEVGTGGRLSVTDSIVSDHSGVVDAEGSVPVWRYNLHHAISGPAFGGMADPTGENGNLAEDPRFVDPAAGDWHLAPGSPAIDAGDPERVDADGSRGDMGAWGGPNGSWP